MHKKVNLIKRWIALVLVMALIFSVDTAAMAQADAGYGTECAIETEQSAETELVAETEPASANETENVPETDMILETEAVYETETVLETQAAPDPDEPDPCDRRPEQENAMEVTGEDMVRLMAENREIKAYGIDVYSGDGIIDWQAVYDEGVRFAFIRCGYRGFGDGVLYKDDNFRKNAKGALAAGIQIGTYFFSTAITEAEIMEEARFVCEQIKDFDLTYPVAFDYEGYNVSYYRNYNISYAKRNTFAQKYLNYMQSQGYKVMLYSSAGHLRYNSEWNTTKLEQLYPIWVAQYWMKSADPYLCFQSFKEIGSRTTSYERSYKIWQFSEHGKLNGIKTYVDLNIEYLDPGKHLWVRRVTMLI